MKIYLVGGAVRDTLLGLTPKDKDFVVVGATPEEMLAQGYHQVGASFPVFLKDGEEYALARTERKTGVGYHGFDVVYDKNVTLEDDLIRRDLTINSMAMDGDVLIDPYGGKEDLRLKVLRHTSEAFAEDPIRVLRTARFQARYSTFDIHPNTIKLMMKVVPELKYVPAERIWMEIEKGLNETDFYKMFVVMDFVRCFEIDALKPFSKFYHHIDYFKQKPYLTPVERFAALACGFETDDDFVRLKVPTEYARLAKVVNAYAHQSKQYSKMTPEEKLRLFDTVKVLNDQKHAEAFCRVVFDLNSVDYETFWNDVEKVKRVDAASISKMFTSGQQIKQAIFNARLAALSG